jgi:hypothetical protein
MKILLPAQTTAVLTAAVVPSPALDGLLEDWIEEEQQQPADIAEGQILTGWEQTPVSSDPTEPFSPQSHRPSSRIEIAPQKGRRYAGGETRRERTLPTVSGGPRDTQSASLVPNGPAAAAWVSCSPMGAAARGGRRPHLGIQPPSPIERGHAWLDGNLDAWIENQQPRVCLAASHDARQPGRQAWRHAESRPDETLPQAQAGTPKRPGRRSREAEGAFHSLAIPRTPTGTRGETSPRHLALAQSHSSSLRCGASQKYSYMVLRV